MCRARVRKTKAHLELNLVRFVNVKKRDFYKYMEKAEVFNAFFYVSFCWKDQPLGIPGL